MAAPTNFLPIVRRAAQRSHAFQKAGENKYGVLVILTDGEISDFDQTRDEIVRVRDNFGIFLTLKLFIRTIYGDSRKSLTCTAILRPFLLHSLLK
jgi:hypothetical protein